MIDRSKMRVSTKSCVQKQNNSVTEMMNPMDETRVRAIVADLMEDVVVAKPDDPITFLLEMLQGTGKKPGDAETTRRLKAVLSSEEKLLEIAKNFPHYRRQIKDALDQCDGTIEEFQVTAKEALAGPSGPLSL